MIAIDNWTQQEENTFQELVRKATQQSREYYEKSAHDLSDINLYHVDDHAISLIEQPDTQPLSSGGCLVIDPPATPPIHIDTTSGKMQSAHVHNNNNNNIPRNKNSNYNTQYNRGNHYSQSTNNRQQPANRRTQQNDNRHPSVNMQSQQNDNHHPSVNMQSQQNDNHHQSGNVQSRMTPPRDHCDVPPTDNTTEKQSPRSFFSMDQVSELFSKLDEEGLMLGSIAWTLYKKDGDMSMILALLYILFV